MTTRTSKSVMDFGFLRHGSMSPETDDDHGFDDDRFFEEVDDFNHDIDIFGSADRDGEPMTKEALVEAGGEEDTSEFPPPPAASSMCNSKRSDSVSSTTSFSGLNIRSKAKAFLSRGNNSSLSASVGGIASKVRSLGSRHQKPAKGGLIWHAQVVSDDYFDTRTCTTEGHLKNRRPVPIVRASEFFADLEYAGGKWIHRAPLNGWDGLTDLQLISVTGKVKSMGQAFRIRRYWNYDTDKGTRPNFPDRVRSVRITLIGPDFTSQAFTSGNPGHCWWYNRFDDLFVHGEAISKNFRQLEATRGLHEATKVHHFAHRYAKAKESTKDRIVYHSAILLEWSHGRYSTVFELAFLNGVSGYGGRANWHEDSTSLDPPPKLLQALPGYMICPWHTNLAEVRINDVPSKNWAEFTTYLTDHESPSGLKDHRFLDVNHISSSDVKLSVRSESAIARYVNNYIRHNKEYHEESRNCQTFAADFYRLLTGDPKVKPFHPICQILYHHHEDWFLFDPPK